MALKVVTMAELRIEVLLEVERTGLTVSEVCRRFGISRQNLLPVSASVSGRRAGRPGGPVASAAGAGQPDPGRA